MRKPDGILWSGEEKKAYGEPQKSTIVLFRILLDGCGPSATKATARLARRD